MPINIQKIKDAIASDKIKWTEHAAKRLINRRISPDEVLQALSNGTIIEDYPSDYPFPSCLVLRMYTAKQNAAHRLQYCKWRYTNYHYRLSTRAQ